MGYRELLFGGLVCGNTVTGFRERGVEARDNTTDEPIEAGKEMAARLKTVRKSDPVRQSAFHAIGVEFNLAFRTWPTERRVPGAERVSVYVLPCTIISKAYCEINPWFLGR